MTMMTGFAGSWALAAVLLVAGHSAGLAQSSGEPDERANKCRELIVGDSKLTSLLTDRVRELIGQVERKLVAPAGAGTSLLDLWPHDVEGKFHIPVDDCVKLLQQAELTMESGACREVWSEEAARTSLRKLVEVDAKLASAVFGCHVCDLLTYKLAYSTPVPT